MVPEVRFAGFSGEWEELNADKIFYSVSDKNHSNLPVLSASQEKGMVYRDEIGIDIKYDEKSTKNYKRVLPGQFVIHLRSFQGGFAFSNIEGITSPAYTVLDFKNKEKYYSLFWRYVLASYTFIKRLETVTYGIRDGRSISFSDFSTLKFRVPSYDEQAQIGNLFKKLDDMIAFHQQELTTLKQTKQGFLQKMFPKEGKSIPEVRFSGYSEEWEEHSWINVVEMSTNMVDPKTREYDEIYHVGPGNIESFSGRILDNVQKVKDDNLISGKFYFDKGDIIYGKINPQLAKYAVAPFEGLASADTYVLNSKNGIEQGFLYTSLQTRDFYKYSVSVSRRTGMPKINRDELNKYKFLAPREEEQIKIGNFFKQLDDLINLHQRELDALKETKKAFLQKMFV
ncbi:restriction endonuclease subunit S [Seinonella peptonophila]|uniref:restriction endonuclease subunit S n=1 Tax=Seinonella peptonophila TaxID=112248 RepID=UPI001C312154|nr:restriction endonuclease subunit S [Seinonella peptonophila]